ncbi:hypothetical protein AXG89_33270 (plasmid) [Burkholderia sp. PAMC 26561]|nr:hypothetical protein AXG89_33270 [Burkholderia sp. PAMC 26561]
MAVAAVALLGASSSWSETIAVAKRYPGPWKDDFNLEITKSLAWNKVAGCGEYKYRASSLDKDEFLVYCSSDDVAWTAYLVWPVIHKIIGPLRPDASLN